MGGRSATSRRASRSCAIFLILATVAVKWLQRPPYNLGLKMALGVLCGVGAFGIILSGRKAARYGLRLPPNIRGAQLITLVALFLGVVLAYGASQGVQRIDTGYFLTPQTELHLNLAAFFFGQHIIMNAKGAANIPNGLEFGRLQNGVWVVCGVKVNGNDNRAVFFPR